MRNIFLFLSLLVILFTGCNNPDKKLIGQWEYDSFEVDESGLGFLFDYVPADWMENVEEWIEKTKGISNSVYTFNPDGTYKESFSGPAEGFTTSTGRFSVTRDEKLLRLIHEDQEYVMQLLSLEEDAFIYVKEFKKYQIPLSLKIKYKRIEK